MNAPFAAVVLVGLVASASLASAAPRAAIALVAAPPDRLPVETVDALCAKLAPPCATPSTQALVGAGAPQGRLYLLDGERPWIAILDERDPADASRARVFDFSGRRHSTPPLDRGGVPAPMHLHPALYPIGASGLAVAIVSTTRETYSGGGSFFDVADFVVLDTASPARSGPPDVVYAGVPFACSKTIRACFSEKEYRRSPHCTDDETGHLTIAFDNVAATPPRWSFRWHELSWPANVAQSKQRWTRAPFTVPAGPRDVAADGAAELASFCGGPAS